MKKAWLFVCVAFIAGIMITNCFAQEGQEIKEKNISGVVEEVAPDGSFVMINAGGSLNKVVVPADMQEYFNMEKGDQVEIIIQEINGEWQAVDYDYL